MAVSGNPIPLEDDPIVDHTQLNAGTPPAPAAVAATTNSGGFGASSTGFGGTTNGGFGSSSSGASTFGSAPAGGGFGSSSGFGSAPSSGGFGSSTSGGFGGSTGGFSGGMGGGFGGGMNPPQQQIPADANTTAAFGNAIAASEGKEPEHWMKAFWRPAMGWLYMLICLMDFVVFPTIAMFLPIIEKGFGMQMGYTPWQSLTLSNGGLIHLAFGAILGVSAYGRTQEKKTGTV